MKKLVLFCFAACVCVFASAQKVYFLYLQSDDQTPFYVKMGEKILSSAASGYLIVPNLTDGSYSFGLGFAKSNAAEVKFSVSINQNDKGFIIKHFDEGLALFDIQDLSLVKANAVQQDNTVFETKTDKFSTILSKAANDPGLLKVPVVNKEESVAPKPFEKEVTTAKMEETKPVEQPVVDTTSTQPQGETVKTGTPGQETTIIDTIASTRTVANEIKEPDVQQEGKKDVTEVQTTVYKPSFVSRYSESSTTEGFGIVYFDKKEDGVDTIRILIPAPRVRLVAEKVTVPATEVVTKAEIADTLTVVEKTETLNTTSETTAAAPVSETTSATTVTNVSECKNNASDKDFLKLRRKMASKDNDDDMLDEARKEFRGKCYSVEQVRYLSALFLTSASKYRFFDAAYEHVSDRSNFTSLGSEIKDEHYTKRFKALIGE
jgi:hypothetical protein